MSRTLASGTVQYTPMRVAKWCVNHMKIPAGAITLDPARGAGAFYDLLPEPRRWCELDEGRDFFDHMERVDYIVTNPPFAKLIGGKKRPLLWPWIAHCLRLAGKGVGLLMQAPRFTNLLTPSRLDAMQAANFPITSISLLEVPIWAGRYAWVEWRKGGKWCLDFPGRGAK